MWNRSILKENAKTALFGNRYWMAVAVCLTEAFIMSIFSFVTSFDSTKLEDLKTTEAIMQFAQKSSGISFISMLISIFVGLPLAVGLARYFIHNRFGQTKYSMMFSAFDVNYGSTVAGMFTTVLFIILWGILLIIPGIVKALQYIMVPYILSDNPSMPGSRARQISRMMTNGEKGDMFVLDLSFIGWYLLAGLAAGLVNVVSAPLGSLVGAVAAAMVAAYVNATFAELYIFMRDRIIRTGAVTAEELGLAY